MKSKALIVAGLPPFMGPKVFLEKGKWSIRSAEPEAVVYLLQKVVGERAFKKDLLDHASEVQGPMIICCELISAPGPVNIDAQQIEL